MGEQRVVQRRAVARPPGQAAPQHYAPPQRGGDAAPAPTAREGDVLFVSYPEVKMPTAINFLNVGGGALSIQRVMREGEDFAEVYEQLYGLLKEKAERDAVAKRDWYVQWYRDNKPALGK